MIPRPGKTMLQLMLAGALATGMALAAHGGSEAASFTGHWKVTINSRCVNSAQNAKVCGVVFGKLKGIGVKGTVFTEKFSVTVNVASNGHYTAAGGGTLTESASGAKLKACPSLKQYGSVLFNGACTIAQSYKGHIANNPHGFPEFFGETYTLTYQGKKVGTFKDDNSGLPSPAKVGTYSASWAASLAGSKSVPSGFTFKEVVTR